MSSTLNKHVAWAETRVLFHMPFFVAGVAQLPVVWDETIPTACTDGKVIKWNPKFFQFCHDKDRNLNVSVMCEEVGHCLLGHLWRAPEEAKGNPGLWALWNIACDSEVRWMISEYGESIRNPNTANPVPWLKECEPQEEYRGLVAEEVYRRLKDKASSGGGGGCSMEGKSMGDFEQPSGSEQEQDARQTEWRNVMIQSAETCKVSGSGPTEMIRKHIAELLDPVIPWFDLLRNFLVEQTHDDFNFMKPSPAYSDSDFMMPSVEGESIGEVVFATDVSASIYEKMLNIFQSEKQACLDTMHPRKVIDIYCDDRIQDVREYNAGEEMSLETPSGGGTSFVPVFDLLEERGIRPRCLVYLTDLCGAFPDVHPDFPVLWITWEKDQTAPFGQVIFADNE